MKPLLKNLMGNGSRDQETLESVRTALAEIQKAHPDTIIGSYPKYLDGSFWTELVVRAPTGPIRDAPWRPVPPGAPRHTAG